jgi:hypothetical protein
MQVEGELYPSMRKFSFFVLFFACGLLYSQEALKSPEEEYYDFLALQGLTERPTLNYRTLSDSVWSIGKDLVHPWQGQNLGTKQPLFGDILMRVYGPELFMSANTAAPYGQNDGALWQGRGLNLSLTGGLRLEGYGVEATFKPQLAFSQNAAFDIMQSNYDSEYGYFWGYGHNIGVDAPQRFGNKPFFTWDWGDSEIRYTWKTLTIGFGTQPIWLGPAYLNPVLHSNNAPTYPKFDIGLRKQKLTIPGINWYAGEVEVRFWIGRLSESEYFDNISLNDYNMIHGLSFAYSPSFLPGLTLSANRVCLVPWSWENLKYIFPSSENTIEDQKSSFGLSWIVPQIELEIYGEIGVDDYVYGGIMGYIRNPFWTMAYDFGVKKTINIIKEKGIYGEFIFEASWFDRTIPSTRRPSSYTFYMHHQIQQGYTNQGQWLANATNPGGNSQSLSFSVFYPQGKSRIFAARDNPDNNYLYAIDNKGFANYWANFLLGLDTAYFITPSIMLSGGLIYDLIINQHYIRQNEITEDGYQNIGKDTYKHNFSICLSLAFSL